MHGLSQALFEAAIESITGQGLYEMTVQVQSYNKDQSCIYVSNEAWGHSYSLLRVRVLGWCPVSLADLRGIY